VSSSSGNQPADSSQPAAALFARYKKKEKVEERSFISAESVPQFLSEGSVAHFIFFLCPFASSIPDNNAI
jgi:hypothetical protein